MKNMLFTLETLAKELDVSPEMIENWELELGLNIQEDTAGKKKYFKETLNFFKKVESLVSKGFALYAVKDLLALDIEQLNVNENIIETFVLDDEDALTKAKEEEKIETTEKTTKTSFANESLNNFKNNLEGSFTKSDIMVLFETIMQELKRYTERTIEAEKKVYLLEDHENRIKEDYYEVTSEVKKLKTQLDEKDQKIKDYDEQKKRLNLMEVQLKILQIEKNKKKFWEFWK